MKLLRLIAVVFAVLLVLVATAIAVLFLPSVQTKIARSVLSRPGPVTGEVERVNAGLKATEWSNLQLRGVGWTLTMPSAHAEVPLAGAIHHDLQVHAFTAHGWVLDLSASNSSQPVHVSARSNRSWHWHRLPQAIINFAQVTRVSAQANTPSAIEVFRGVFPMLDLPVDLSVDQVDLEGEIIFRSQTGGPVERIHVTMTGGGLAAGRSGRFVVTGETSVIVPSTPLSAVRGQFEIEARLATPRHFDLLQLDGHLSAENQKATGPRLFLNAAVTRGVDHEA